VWLREVALVSRDTVYLVRDEDLIRAVVRTEPRETRRLKDSIIRIKDEERVARIERKLGCCPHETFSGHPFIDKTIGDVADRIWDYFELDRPPRAWEFKPDYQRYVGYGNDPESEESRLPYFGSENYRLGGLAFGWQHGTLALEIHPVGSHNAKVLPSSDATITICKARTLKAANTLLSKMRVTAEELRNGVRCWRAMQETNPLLGGRVALSGNRV